jgi:hypothetical protein
MPFTHIAQNTLKPANYGAKTRLNAVGPILDRLTKGQPKGANRTNLRLLIVLHGRRAGRSRTQMVFFCCRGVGLNKRLSDFEAHYHDPRLAPASSAGIGAGASNGEACQRRGTAARGCCLGVVAEANNHGSLQAPSYLSRRQPMKPGISRRQGPNFLGRR